MRCVIGLLDCTVLGHVWETCSSAHGLPIGRQDVREHGNTAADQGPAFRSHSEAHDYILVYPPKKLAFCYIPKVACAEFNYLFNRMNQFDDLGILGESSLASFNLSLQDVSRENGWKWAFFVRNPLLRYLSAWGLKCVQKEDNGVYCLHGMVSEGGSVSDFERHVLASSADPSSVHFDPHWEQQQLSCGGLGNAARYDFVGSLHGNVNLQVRGMLSMVGAPEGHVEEFFRGDGVIGHHSSLDPNLYYKNVSMRRAIRDIYLDDYRLPGLLEFAGTSTGLNPGAEPMFGRMSTGLNPGAKPILW